MRPIGITLPFKPVPSVPDYIACMADLGFNATFGIVHEPAEQARLAELCAARGIPTETLHAPFGHINDMWLPGEGGDAMLDELKQTVDHCLIAGAPIAVVHLSAGDNAPSITDIGRERFARLVEYAQTKNVRIAFENQRKLANLAWAFETFSTADGVDFCWDCGHEGCFTPGRQYMPLFGDRLACTHIHDNHQVYNGDEHLLPFDGTIDFSRVAAQIAASPFRGTVMLEASYDTDGYYSHITADEYLQRAFNAARRLAEMVGD